MGKPELDEFDRRIIELLRLDGRMPNAVISRELGLGEGAVRRRLTRLTEAGAVRVIGVSPAELHGLATTVAFSFQLPLNKVEGVVAALIEMDEIAFVYETSGRFNLLAQGFFADQTALRDFLTNRLSAVDGLGTVETLTILSTRKSDFKLTSRRLGP